MISHSHLNDGYMLLDRVKSVSLRAMLGLWAMAGLLGCAQKNESQEDDSGIGYPLLGVVQSVNLEAGVMSVAHEDIPGFMPAMTMDFRVSPGDLKMAQPGMRIRARLVRDDDGGFRLVRIWPVDEEAARKLRETNERLAEQAESLRSGYYFGPGDAFPDFALLDQNGQLVTPESLEGKPFVLNFIFTRCKDAKMCPLSTSKMAQLQRMAAEEQISDLQFVSVTLDPQYDTPGVLREYADAYGIDGSNFRFVTGPKEAVKLLVQSLKVTSIPREDDDIMHSLATVLVDRSRSIALRSEKSAWEPEEFLAAIKNLP